MLEMKIKIEADAAVLKAIDKLTTALDAISFDDGSVLSADTPGSWGDALEGFFKELSAE